MLREAAEVTVTGPSTTKSRKRCAQSSSGASSESQRRRKPQLKRGVRLTGRRGGAASPCLSRRRRMSESSWNRHYRFADVETWSTSAASARKLVSALWQLNKGGAFEEEGEIGWDAAAARRTSDHWRSASVEFSKMSRRKSKALKDDGERSWRNGHGHGQWFSDVVSNGGTVEVHPCPQGLSSPCPGDRMAQLQGIYNSLAASNELVRVLANVLGPAGGLNPTAASLLSALRSELDVARGRAGQLVRQHKRHGDESSTEHLRRQLLEEVRVWKSRHKEKAAAYARLVASELDGERRSRRRAERASKKLGEALAEAESSLRMATRELERERASRERLEKVCDELASGGFGGAAEEELRREAESAREEMERERKMLQLADELREERVRMKLAEARLQFEEKNAVVDRLRQELEAFLDSNKDRQESPPEEHHRVVDGDHLLQLVLASESGVQGIDRLAVDKNGQEGEGEGEDGGECGEVDDSEGSDIELNMDGNSWSYMTTSRETTAKNAVPMHGSPSDRGTECGASDRRSEGMGEALEQDWDEGCSNDRTTTKDLDEDAERYEAIKNLREQMLAGHGFVFLSQGGADADGDRHRHDLISQIEEGGLW
ncbi:uncharacterized protein LOC133920540 [Phragmites australis]|uniref:uncharacterized protein LOC133920540 n=1 Tax=Phragmites australis TaxID=29695 RepID=UPI002D7754AB|nr:uncharacterized protein LOC133920540 [Phragmites australis]